MMQKIIICTQNHEKKDIKWVELKCGEIQNQLYNQGWIDSKFFADADSDTQKNTDSCILDTS